MSAEFDLRLVRLWDIDNLQNLPHDGNHTNENDHMSKQLGGYDPRASEDDSHIQCSA